MVVIWVFAAYVKSVYSHLFSAEQFIRRYVVAVVTLKHAERRARAPYGRNDKEDQSVVTMGKELLCVALRKFCVRPTQKGQKVTKSGNPPPIPSRECFCKHRTVLFALGNLPKTQTHSIWSLDGVDQMADGVLYVTAPRQLSQKKN